MSTISSCTDSINFNNNTFYNDGSVLFNSTLTACTGIWTSNIYGCSPITVHDSVQSITSSATGTTSFAFGNQVKSHGNYSHAEGTNTTASGNYSHSEGGYTTASGYGAHSEGTGSIASGGSSHAEGNDSTTASGIASHAEGSNTLASGIAAHSEGTSTQATGTTSHAEGISTKAYGDYSHTEGTSTIARGVNSHAEGANTIASGEASHAEGVDGTEASGSPSHAEGTGTLASGSNSHTEGSTTIASNDNSHAEGVGTIASGINSHAEGLITIASGSTSHAEGDHTIAGGKYSHAEGSFTTASGLVSHSEGGFTTASGSYSHAEGRDTIASGYGSHAEGQSGIASGDYSHVGGRGSKPSIGSTIIASGNTSFIHFEQTVNSGIIGSFGDNSAILGGTDHMINSGATSSGIFVGSDNIIDNDVLRSVVLGGSNITGTTSDTVYVPNLNIASASTDNSLTQILSRDSSDGSVKYRDVSSIISAATSQDTFVTGSTLSGDTLVLSRNDGVNLTTNLNSLVFTGNTSGDCITDLYITNLYGCSPITLNDNLQHISSSATGVNSIAFGSGTAASGDYSHSEGYDTIASGDFSHAEGKNTIASGVESHAEGFNNTASGGGSHAEGSSTSATTSASHSEGGSTLASGEFGSHAEGFQTTASGWIGSHAQGAGTLASGWNGSHAAGQGFNYTTRIEAAGKTSFIHYNQTISATTGAYGDYSAILGGNNHNIGAGGTSSGIFAGSGNTINNDVLRSVVLGGFGIAGISGDTVYVPNLNIDTIPGNDNSLTQILSRDSSDGTIKYRDVSSIIGAASADTYVISGNANASNSTLTFTNNSGSTFTVTNSAALFSDNDINVTGGTYNPSDGCVTFATNSGTTFDVCGFLTGFTDNNYFVTGATFSNNLLSLQRSGGLPDVATTINNFTGLTVNGSVSATTYYGDGSNLTGISTDDNYVTGGTFSSSTLTLNRQNGLVTITGFSSSVLVNETVYVDALNGSDSAGVRGDMSLPYLTISGANQTAITGDTVHVRPGTYQENDIIKDGVAYYFDKGAIIHPLEALQVSDNKAIIDIDNHTNKAIVLGYGVFISDNNTYVGTNVCCIYVDSDEAHIEFDTAYMRASTASGGARATVSIQQTGTDDSQEVFIKGVVKKDNSQGGVPQSAMLVGGGNTRFEGKIIQNGTGTAGQGLYINNDSADFRGTGEIYCDGDTADSYAFISESRGRSLWYGNIVAGNHATCYAYHTGSNYTGDSAVFGNFDGAIKLSLGGHEGRGSYISGLQTCSASPNGFAITCDDGSFNVVDLVIASYTDVFSISEGALLFQGSVNIHSDNQPLLTQTGGKFIFNGMVSPIARRLTNSTITGGECVIQSDFEQWGSNYPADEYLFYVDGGTLRIDSCKVESHQSTTGSGVIEVSSNSGSTVILNSATLISENNDPTAYSIKTPSSSSLNIEIHGDSYTNRPVGPGTIRNTIPNGGFLYPITGCTTVYKYCDWNISGKTTTTNFQMTSGATNAYVLTSDAVGNASWQPSIDGNTFVTGFTYDNINTFTISDNDGSTFSASINILSATTISATTYYGDGSNLTGISTDDNYVTGGTFSSGTLTLDRQNGSVTVTGFTTDTNTTVTGYTYNDANTFTISNSDGSNYSASINTMTGLTINGDLNVNGESVFSGNSTDVVQIYGSGSTSPIFRVQGSSGELFSITDDLTGELFAVNNISGLPILQVYSDNRIILGDNLAPSLYTTAKVTANSGSLTSVYSVPVSAYTGAWFEYTAKGTTSLRAGNIASIFSGTSVNHNETTTTDIGDTSDLLLDVIISGTNATLTASATTSNWEIKTIIRSI